MTTFDDLLRARHDALRDYREPIRWVMTHDAEMRLRQMPELVQSEMTIGFDPKSCRITELMGVPLEIEEGKGVTWRLELSK